MVDSPNQFSNRIGVEISSTALNAVVIGGNDAIISSQSVPVIDADTTALQLIRLIEGVKQEFGGFERIGLAVPGLIDRTAGKVAFSANIPKHSEGDIVNEVKAATGLAVLIENDANAAAFAEYRLGAGRGSRDMFYATLGEGVGGAFIFDGEIWRGASGFAGEFGYVPINSEGTRLEDVASSANIIRRTRGRFHTDSTSSLNKISEEAITLTDIISAAGNDDDFAQMMLERTGMYVGTAVASVINLLNIEKIVVGGEIMEAKQLVLDAIVERARELSFSPSFASTSIVEGELGVNAAAAGAALISGQTG
ncbi:MAG: ROK family protein [Pyrinomonadaceae bacterium]